jgi:hypothetical protein
MLQSEAWLSVYLPCARWFLKNLALHLFIYIANVLKVWHGQLADGTYHKGENKK